MQNQTFFPSGSYIAKRGNRTMSSARTMTTRQPLPTESIECPLCLGAGKLKRTEILDRLGVRDFVRVAQLSAEEAFRLLQGKHDHDHQQVWSRFETELAKKTAEIIDRHKDELRSAQSNRDDLT